MVVGCIASIHACNADQDPVDIMGSEAVILSFNFPTSVSIQAETLGQWLLRQATLKPVPSSKAAGQGGVSFHGFLGQATLTS